MSGRSIWQGGHGNDHGLEGVIGPTGHFQMTSATGDRVIAGAISGDRLTGTDTSPPVHHKHQRGYVQIPDEDCHAAIDARRIAPGSAGTAD